MVTTEKPELVEHPPIQKSMRGRRFEQSSLDAKLDGAIFGQSVPIQLLVLVVAVLIVFIPARSVGEIGGLLGSWSLIGIAIKTEVGQAHLLLASCVAVLLCVWALVAIFYNLPISLLLIFPTVACAYLSLQFGLLGLFPEGDVRETVGLIPELYIYGLTYSVPFFIITRLAIATTAILFPRSLLVTFIVAGVIFIASLMGGLSTASIILDDPTIKPLIDELALTEQQTLKQTVELVAPLAGITTGLLLFAGSGWANRRRNVPWHYPDLFRDLALILGSWRGTSFHQLDLSSVSLRGAQLANSDLRARRLYRTCFQGVTGLERARVNNRYLDLEIPKVQKLLTHATSDETDYNRLNLRGAYLQGADLRRMSFIDTDLSGADLQAADLRGAILARTQAIDVDFSNANLTGICIQNWSVNEQTSFSNVLCDYVYRELDDKGEPTDRYPADRNFEPQEFESLYQEIGNVAELIFKEGVNWRAFSFSMQKLDLEDNGLGLELKGFERRGDRWVVRVTYNQEVPRQEVEHRLMDMYEDMKGLLTAKEQQINKLLGIASDQAEALKEISQKPFGNNFLIVGSTITNLSGSGNIEYTVAANQVREIITHGSDRKQVAPLVKQFVQELKQQDVAATGAAQLELMQQLIVAEAESDPEFEAYLLRESQQLLRTMAGSPLTNVIQGAIAQLGNMD